LSDRFAKIKKSKPAGNVSPRQSPKQVVSLGVQQGGVRKQQQPRGRVRGAGRNAIARGGVFRGAPMPIRGGPRGFFFPQTLEISFLVT